MSLLMFEPFDSGDVALRPGRNIGGSTSFGSTYTRFGYGKSFVTSYVNANNYAYFTVPAASQIYVGFAVRANSSGQLNSDFFGLQGDNGTVTHLTLRFTANNVISVYRAGTLLASGTFSGSVVGAFPYVEIGASISSTVGVVTIRVNNAQVLTFTGNTKNGGTNSSIDTVYMTGSGSNDTVCYDDLYICDGAGAAPANTFLGDVRAYTEAPTGAGASTQFTPSTGTNWSCVDENPYSAADNVQDGVSGHRDTYAMADLPGGVGTVIGVQAVSIAKKTDAGVILLKNAVKSSATIAYGSSVALSTSDAALLTILQNDPATSAAWTAAAVNAVEAGFEVV